MGIQSLVATCFLVFAIEKPDLPGSVEKINQEIRSAIVVIKTQGRNESREALGTGFFISKDGLVVTNYHVIGEGKKITIENVDKSSFEVSEIVHMDRERDLAVLKAPMAPAKWLALGKNQDARDGAPVVAVGNPQGLKHSVVAGVLSGKRNIDGKEMLQVAIPIEPGNSGGPIVNQAGEVLGILTIKSLVTENLGFAIPVDALRKLISQKPLSIPMKAWATIGALDESSWEVIFEGGWRQRAGKILGQGAGAGFGGRSLLMNKVVSPANSYEVEVWVKLEDEAGAAGLVFASDEKQKQYGFYPSNSQLRLTHFKGPDVYSWQVIKQEAFPFYQPLEWNHLRVVIQDEKMRCYLNDQLAYEIQTEGSLAGRAGLARFRGTKAQFRGFRIHKEVQKTLPDPALAKQLESIVSSSTTSQAIQKLAMNPGVSRKLIDKEILKQQKKLEQLQGMKIDLSQAEILRQLALVSNKEKVHLVEAALWISKLEHSEILVEDYLQEFKSLAHALGKHASQAKSTQEKISALNQFFFKEKGFHGSIQDYYSRSNSCMSEVMDDREGIPITLCVLYMELARTIGLTFQGLGFSGHFMVGMREESKEWTVVDVFDGGKTLTMKQAALAARERSGRDIVEKEVKPATDKEILVRILTNISNVAQREKDDPAVVRFLDGILQLDPSAHLERSTRALVLSRLGKFDRAIMDIDYLMEAQPDDLNLDQIKAFRLLLLKQAAQKRE